MLAQSKVARRLHCTRKKSAFPCFLGVGNSKECFNLKYTCVDLRTLTIENAKIYDKSLRLLRVRNKGLKDVVILPDE